METTINDVPVFADRRSRGLAGQFWSLILQPGAFFRRMASAPATSQWVWIAVLILILAGVSAVQQTDLQEVDTAAPVDSPEIFDPGMSSGPFGGPPPEGTPQQESSADPEEVASKWSTALESGGTLILHWIGLAILLSMETLLRGRRPLPNRNLQIAVWASIPLGMMAAIQLIYFAMGGEYGQHGISGLLLEWDRYLEFNDWQQDAILSLASSFTIFWLWSLMLVYLGGRFALNGRRWSVMIVMLMWISILTFAPVVLGSVDAQTFIEENIPAPDNSIEQPFEETPFESPMIEDEGIPAEQPQGLPDPRKG
jgi:hypothetical protein